MTPSSPHRAAHISSAPDETYLLTLQLQHEGIEVDVQRVSNKAEFAAVVGLPVSLLIADLPLPWPGADDDLNELQRTRPDIPVVFRWGGPGAWTVEDATAQLGRSVRTVLALGVDREQTGDERRAVLQEVVRYQNVHLKLGQLDTWAWEEALRDATRIIADAVSVERVSIWRLDADRRLLECEILFTRSRREHHVEPSLRMDEAYRKAIESATFVAAHDARRDPRTSGFTDAYLVPLGITSMLDAPIRSRGRVAGVICLEHVGPARRWSVVEQCAGAAFASIAGRILDARERRRFEEQCEEARRLEAMGRMASAVAHDFSTLATIVVGFSEVLLNETPPGDPRREAIDAIHEAGVSATSLVRQLLSYSKPPSTQTGCLDVCAEVRAMEPLVRQLLGPSVTVSIQVPAESLWVRMESTEFRRVVLNLATNSRDAMPDGGTFRLVLDPPVTWHVGVVRLSAIDDGEGIPQDVLPNVFKPLYTTKGDRGGTGLGLATAHAICAQAGGGIRVESSPGSTSFIVELPCVSPPARPQPVATPDSPSLARAVLVVDDVPVLAALIRRMLERSGCRVEVMTSPEEAIERARVIGPDLGLVITDLNMRGMSGSQLVYRLREIDPALPVLIVTGQPNAPEAERLQHLAHTAVLSKPFDGQTLVARVRALMSLAPTTSADSPVSQRPAVV